jgi:hypothetical protein
MKKAMLFKLCQGNTVENRKIFKRALINNLENSINIQEFGIVQYVFTVC